MLDTPIIVSDEIVKENDWFYNKSGFVKINKAALKFGTTIEYPIKIIAGLPKLPSIDFNGFEEQLEIVDVEKLAKYHYEMIYLMAKSDDVEPYVIRDFISGYEAAQKLNKKKFTLEDIKEAVNVGLSLSTMTDEPFTSNIFKVLKQSTIDGWVNSLSQPKVFDIEIEMEVASMERSYSNNTFEEADFISKITDGKIKITNVL